MGFLSFLKNLNLGVGMPHMPTTTSAGTMQTKELLGSKQANKTPLAGDNHEITGWDEDTRIKSDESGSCTSGMNWTFNHPARKDNVEGKLEEAVSGQRTLANFKGDQGLGNVASSENAGQIECKVNFLGLPIRPGGKECPSYMRTGGCESASRCRFHHPDPTAVVGDTLQDRKNGVPSQHQGLVLCGTPRPSENTSNERTAFLGQFTPNRGVQQNVHWIGNPTTTIPLHPQEMNINDHRKTVPNKDVEYGFSGAELQQFEEYPQRPSEPECQYFMKTGYCKYKSACRYHHPKSNVSSFGLREGLVSDNCQHRGTVEQMSATPLCSENCSNGQTAFSGSSSSVPGLFPPNQGLKPNAQSNENQTITNLLHPPEIIKTIDQQQELANKNTAYEFSGGEPQHFDGYPQRPSEPECQHFMKTGYCKFKSACRYHHPKLNLSSLSLPLRPASNNYEKDGPAEQSCEKSLPSENTTNDQTVFLCPSTSNVSGLFTPNLGFQPNMQWNEDQMATSPLDPPEINTDEKGQELANKYTSYEFNDGAKSQQFDEYPQRPGKPECQYFVKTGYCKFKSACRFHHPKPNLSDQALPPKPMVTSPLDPPEIKIDEKGPELANKNTVHIFNGSTKSQHFDEYPQRPTETECQHFMKTGYCKFKSACRFHHPKSHLSFQAPPVKPIATSPLNPPPPEIKKNKKDQKLATKDTVQEFNGGVKSQQFDEYPQRPSESEGQHFMKTGSSKGKSACKSHHPKSNLSVPARPQKSDKQTICTHYSRGGNCKFGSACRFSHHIEHT